MKLKPRSRINHKNAKTVLRLLGLEHAKVAVLNSLPSPNAQRGYVMLSTSSLTGTLLNLVWLSTGQWLCNTEVYPEVIPGYAIAVSLPACRLFGSTQSPVVLPQLDSDLRQSFDSGKRMVVVSRPTGAYK
jgi:hypothetical protein